MKEKKDLMREPDEEFNKLVEEIFEEDKELFEALSKAKPVYPEYEREYHVPFIEEESE